MSNDEISAAAEVRVIWQVIVIYNIWLWRFLGIFGNNG